MSLFSSDVLLINPHKRGTKWKCESLNDEKERNNMPSIEHSKDKFRPSSRSLRTGFFFYSIFFIECVHIFKLYCVVHCIKLYVALRNQTKFRTLFNYYRLGMVRLAFI